MALTAARTDSAPLREVRVYVDSGPGVQPISASTYAYGPAPVFWSVIDLPGPGRHTLRVVGVDTTGRALGASAEWTVRLPVEAYTVTPLPDSGSGGGTRFVHTNGTVAGWVLGQRGRQRPALWRNGVLTVIGATDSLDGTATRVNTAGDVLLEYHPPNIFGQSGPYVRVRRADGAMLDVGTMGYTYTTENGDTVAVASCCGIGADLADTRLAVARSYSYMFSGYKSLTFDVARGVRVDSTYGQLVALNNAGQSVEAVTDNTSLYFSTYLVPHGFRTAGLPDAQVASVCDPAGRLSSTAPIDLDESANVLASYCGNAVWLPPAGGASRWLDRVFGASKAIHLSRTGQIVASLAPTGAIYLWRAAVNRTTQVQIAGGTWQVDSLAAVNAAGQIAAHGVDRTTGRAAALLLTPAPTGSARSARR